MKSHANKGKGSVQCRKTTQLPRSRVKALITVRRATNMYAQALYESK